MRYGEHRVESYELENPHDHRVAEARRAIEQLDARKWDREPEEAPIDFKRRVEQAYDLWSEHDVVRLDQEERLARREQWIEDNRRDLRDRRSEAVLGQRDPNLRSGGLFDAVQELDRFEREAREGKNPELNRMLEDLTHRQAARQEYVANHVIGPALDAKLRELELDNVREPESSSSPVAENPKNALHVPLDLMEAANDRLGLKEHVGRRMEELRRERGRDR